MGKKKMPVKKEIEEVEQKLTKEQLEQLKKFQELPQEEQQKILAEQCVFCKIARREIETVKIYEDEFLMAILDINPATPGHTLIFPKQHFQFLFQIPAPIRSRLFELASKISTYLVNVVKSQGINFHVANGPAAGQRIPHFVLNVIPRFEDDGIAFDWEPKKASKGELEKIAVPLRQIFAQEAKIREQQKASKAKDATAIEKELKKFTRRP